MTDLAAALYRHGYGALDLERRRHGGARCYESRMLGRPAVVVGGRDGARLFYDEDVVERHGAVPPPLGRLLFGRGAIHDMDAGPHRERKRLFLDRLAPDQVSDCARLAGTHLRQAVRDEPGAGIKVFSTLVDAYGRAVIAWAGIEIPVSHASALARQYADIVAGFGFRPRAYAKAWRARIRTDAWARDLIAEVRRGQVSPPESSVLRAIADADLDLHTAAVELGNVLRPTVAVAWLGAFAVVALDLAESWREGLRQEVATEPRGSFAQEVRRTAPFVPALAGRVRRDHSYDGVALRRGDLIVLDVRGINLDPELYPEPAVFRPDRFVGVTPDPYTLVPQGGGLPLGHRCPGESLTLQLLATTVEVFSAVDFRVVSSHAVDLTRIPALPPQGVRAVVTSRV